MSIIPYVTPRGRPPASLSIVIPCYNEEEVILETARRVKESISKLALPFEVIYVDDGSKDKTWPMLLDLQKKDPTVKVVKLSRNFGHQFAFTCGVDQSAGEIVVIMDADLQDPPELVHEMILKWHEGYDVVYGKRRSRAGESFAKKFFAASFYRFFRQYTGFSIPADTGDFRLMDRKAVTALQQLKERHRFIRGMVSWIGYAQAPLEYDRPERFAGTTKYPFKKSLKLAVDAIQSFSTAPLRLASYLGFAISVFAFLYIAVVIGLWITHKNLEGWTTMMGFVLLLGGAQLLVLGILGEYIGRIFEQGQGRPLYLVQDVKGEPLRK